MGRILQRSEGMLGTANQDVVLLLNAQSGQYHQLNAVAARVWELLEKPVDQDTIITTLLAEYAVPPEECRAQVQIFLGQLEDRGLLKLV